MMRKLCGRRQALTLHAAMIVRQDVQKEEPTSFTTDRLFRVRRLRPRGEGFVQDRYDDQAVQCCYLGWVVSRLFQAGADDCLVFPS